MTIKPKIRAFIIILFSAALLLLIFSSCGNPIINHMLGDDIEVPSSVFYADDLSGLIDYINNNRAGHTVLNPLTIQFLGSDGSDGDYLKIQNELNNNIHKITGIVYLNLDMRGMSGNQIPDYYFSGEIRETDIPYNILLSKCKIVSIQFPNSAQKIGENAFSLNSDIESVSMPGVTTIGELAFYKAYFLNELFMPEKPPTTKQYSFYGIISGKIVIHVPANIANTNRDAYRIWIDKYYLNTEYVNAYILADQ
ncbi:MAG: leucine-rich repeat domain-containing protein [Treponema sp.]|jgi:hypothetical protein|nr:leucine-rich repeat domain-containing protein [Treponema sp.]